MSDVTPAGPADNDQTVEPVETGSVEAGSTETGPVETGPVETGPVETGPVEPLAGPVDQLPGGDETEAHRTAPAAAAPVRRASGEKGTGAAPAAGAGRTGRRKVREGTVVSNAMEKTAVVVVTERVRHPRYAKTVQRTKRFYVHDEANDVRVGDRVRLSETRPLSKLKRWRVERVLERAR
jgi:small subunit ribosomal protein S17